MEVAESGGAGERKKRRREKAEIPMSNKLQQMKISPCSSNESEAEIPRMSSKRRRDWAAPRSSPCSSNESEAEIPRMSCKRRRDWAATRSLPCSSNESESEIPKMAGKRSRDWETPQRTEKISPCSSNKSEAGMHPECCNEDDSVISGSNIKHPDKEASELTVVEEKKAWEIEVEEFLSAAETKERECFTSKYNYDVVNGVPLFGRYEWVPLTL